MHTLVIYDVPCDRTRHQLSELCKDYGLVRFQFSAFSGELSRSRREEFHDRACRLLTRAPGSKLLIQPVATREIDNAMRIGGSVTHEEEAAQ